MAAVILFVAGFATRKYVSMRAEREPQSDWPYILSLVDHVSAVAAVLVAAVLVAIVFVSTTWWKCRTNR